MTLFEVLAIIFGGGLLAAGMLVYASIVLASRADDKEDWDDEDRPMT